LPDLLSQAILQALAKDPDQRFADAGSMQMALEQYLHSATQISSSLTLAKYFRDKFGSLVPRLQIAGPDTTPREQTAIIDSDQQPMILGQADTVDLVFPGPRTDQTPGILREPDNRSESGVLNLPPPPLQLGLETADAIEASVIVADIDNHETSQISIEQADPPTLIRVFADSTPADGLVSSSARSALRRREAASAVESKNPLGMHLAETNLLLAPPPATSELNSGELLAVRTGSGPAESPPIMVGGPATETTPRRPIGSRPLLLIFLGALGLAFVAGLAGYALLPPAQRQEQSSSPAADATDQLGREAQDQAVDLAQPAARRDSAAARAIGILEIRTTPSKATVAVDGVVYGRTPLRLSLPAGKHAVQLSHLGHASHRVAVDIEANRQLNLVITLQVTDPDPPQAKDVVGEKTGANHGQASKRKKASQHIPSGRDRSSEPTITVLPSTSRKANDGYGVLYLNSVPWSEVFLDGKRLGITPLANVRLRNGSHLLLLRNPERGELKRAISVTADQTLRLFLRFPQQ
jgi:hypothetical protein